MIEPHGEHDPYAALRVRDFRLLLGGRFLASLSEQMIAVAVGYDLYVRTGSALALGFVGLAMISPYLALAMPAGYLADHRDRRTLVMVAQSIALAGMLLLAVLSLAQGSVWLVYLALIVIGAGYALNDPASAALVSQIVPPAAYGNAATWTSSTFQTASVIGPALGGGVIALTGGHTTIVYLADVAAIALYIALLSIIRAQPGTTPTRRDEPALRSLAEGLGFLRGSPIILAAITLDLLAVLFGGATALLPIFALSILHVGATGLGWLRAAPSVGAVIVALTLAHRPPLRRAGRALLLAVAGFGVATIVFGLSRNFWLSLLMLAALGGLDNISVVIRSTIMLTQVPDAMRGRVGAVNGLFVTASNELGGFESGLTASLLGTVSSVVLGGIATVAVVLGVAWLCPPIRRLGTLGVIRTEPDPDRAPSPSAAT
jgi:MFS family permease